MASRRNILRGTCLARDRLDIVHNPLSTSVHPWIAGPSDYFAGGLFELNSAYCHEICTDSVCAAYLITGWITYEH